MDNKGLDFDDALQFCVAKKLKAAILTLDKHFHKLRGVKAYPLEAERKIKCT